MKKRKKLILAFAMVSAASVLLVYSFGVMKKGQTARETKIKQYKNTRYAAGRIIVKFKEGTKITEAVKEKIRKKLKVHEIKDVFPRLKRKDLAEKHGLSRYRVIEFPEDRDPVEVIMEIKKDPNVEWAGPDRIRKVFYAPNDPDYVEQWHLNNIKAEDVWERIQGDSNVVIAIIDTGVDLDHEDLIDNIWVNTDETAGDGRDNDGNGYIDDTQGWDTVYNDNNPNDDDFLSSHGTHVAGITGAKGDNSIGVAGVVWNCMIMPVKVADGSGVSVSSDVAEGIIYAADNGARIINMSLGGEDSTELEEDACNYAYESGCLLIAASGNDSYADFEQYPASYDSVIAVGATDYNDNRASFSNYGSKVEISAPGESIYSTFIRDRYGELSGTSMAAPIVSGSAALLWSLAPSFTNEGIRKVLQRMTDDLGEPARDKEYGYGRINLSKIGYALFVPQMYATIQDAVNAAGEGYTVYVAPGQYIENITMKEGVNVTGGGYEKTVIQGIVLFSGLSSGTLQGFKLTGGGSSVRIENSSGVTVRNCYIYKNRLDGIGTINSSPVIINNTISLNRNGIYLDSTSSPVIKNNIIEGNRYGIRSASASASPVISYNNVYNNSGGNYVNTAAGAGDISLDPAFIAASGTIDVSVYGMYNYEIRLDPNLPSPCIDAGDPDTAYNDIDGSPNDIGAFGGPFGTSFSPTADATGNSAVPLFIKDEGVGVQMHTSKSVSSIYPTEGEMAYQWEFTGVPPGSVITNGDLSSTAGIDISFIPDLAGDYSLMLTVTNGSGYRDTDEISVSVIEGKEIYVPADAPTIQEGLNLAGVGDKVIVSAGTYYEKDLTVPEGVMLKGESAVIDAGMSYFSVLDLDKGYIVIKGLTLQNSAYSLIEVSGWEDVVILENNILNSSPRGIESAGAASCLIIRNNLLYDLTNGIVIFGSNGVSVYNNTLADTRLWGIYYDEESTGGSIENNIICGAYTGIETFNESVYIAYNNIYDTRFDYYSSAVSSTGGIDSDPFFVDFTDDSDYTNDDFHLSGTSPCIDAGDPDSIYNDTDGTQNDMGAYGGLYGNW